MKEKDFSCKYLIDLVGWLRTLNESVDYFSNWGETERLRDDFRGVVECVRTEMLNEADKINSHDELVNIDTISDACRRGAEKAKEKHNIDDVNLVASARMLSEFITTILAIGVTLETVGK